ncbi:MAG: DUF3892 domain-containing protein [Bacteroidota bacterium]
MAALRVYCINKREHYNPHERITHIGGFNANETRWKLTENNAIAGIKNGTYSFYVSINGKSVNVIIAIHNGREYLKTEADGYEPNNLLSLPECPSL